MNGPEPRERAITVGSDYNSELVSVVPTSAAILVQFGANSGAQCKQWSTVQTGERSANKGTQCKQGNAVQTGERSAKSTLGTFSVETQCLVSVVQRSVFSVRYSARCLASDIQCSVLGIQCKLLVASRLEPLHIKTNVVIEAARVSICGSATNAGRKSPYKYKEDEDRPEPKCHHRLALPERANPRASREGWLPLGCNISVITVYVLSCVRS
jgi:hypothetical protein